MSLTNPAAQWENSSDAAVSLLPLTFYVDGSGNVFATDDPIAVTGTVGRLAHSGSDIVLDTTITSGLAAIAKPDGSVLAYD